MAALLRCRCRALLELRDDVLELRAEEDRDDRGRRLVRAEAMVVAGVRDARADEVRVDVHAADDGEEEREELRVRVRVVAGVQEVLALVGRHGPVVVLAGPVDAGERLLVDEQHEAVLRRERPQRRHDDHVVVGADRGRLVDGRHLELAGGHLVVAGLRRDPQAPELAVEIHHEGEDPLADRAEVLVLELLALGRRGAEERAAGEDEVGAELGEAPVDEEVLLLGADARVDARRRRVPEPPEDADRLLPERLLGPEERDLVVERLARVADVRRGDRERDAVRLDLEEDRARDVPRRVAARLEGGADPARRERARVRLALEEVLPGELGDRLPVAGRREERVVLLGGRAGHRHEPVGVVRGAVRHRPLLHAVRDRVDDRGVEGLDAGDRPAELLEDRLREVVALRGLAEHVLAVDVGAGVLEVVLGGRDAVVRDRLDGLWFARSCLSRPCCRCSVLVPVPGYERSGERTGPPSGCTREIPAAHPSCRQHHSRVRAEPYQPDGLRFSIGWVLRVVHFALLVTEHARPGARG